MVNRDKLIFAPCDILLPPYGANDAAWQKWAVIACDQHTSDVGYWDEVEKTVEGTPSTFGLILPEAYLGREKEGDQKARIDRTMKTLDAGWLTRHKHAMIYIERTLATGGVRKGLFGKLDLEHYDYSADTTSAVRPTEGTVAERIPPRVAVREKAVFEAPHVMVFMNDEKDRIIDSLSERKSEMECLYDFDLMLGGGHIAGYLLSEALLEETLERIYALEEWGRESGELIYGMGDGNHSLATAKACYEKLKAADSTAAATKARYAAVEMVSVYDETIVFEPIYRVIKGCDVSALVAAVEAMGGGSAPVKIVTADFERDIMLKVPEGALTVGVLQDLLDGYLKENAGECDYIHDEDVLRRLATADGESVGFLFDGMDKAELFPYVANVGPLPRKTFSMGDASSKRYYLEVRRIKQ
ncbi:MAG: DUF1015 domain-containing protein [Ruminococcaceae bacterium]|nr:DUF1015 domain-containing protein [Oscillospiraceae bacterium]